MTNTVNNIFFCFEQPTLAATTSSVSTALIYYFVQTVGLEYYSIFSVLFLITFFVTFLFIIIIFVFYFISSRDVALLYLISKIFFRTHLIDLPPSPPPPKKKKNDHFFGGGGGVNFVFERGLILSQDFNTLKDTMGQVGANVINPHHSPTQNLLTLNCNCRRFLPFFRHFLAIFCSLEANFTKMKISPLYFLKMFSAI